MLAKPCVMLKYKLTKAAESWFTVAIRAKPMAATINAYSTRSWPCSSRMNRIKNSLSLVIAFSSLRIDCAGATGTRLLGRACLHGSRLALRARHGRFGFNPAGQKLA